MKKLSNTTAGLKEVLLIKKRVSRNKYQMIFKSTDILYFQLYFHITNDIPWTINKISE